MHSVRLIAPPWLTPNQKPFNLANNIAAGASLSIVPANQNVYLHLALIDIDPGGDNTVSVQIADQVGNIFATLHTIFLGAASPSFVPPRAPMDFKGTFLGSNGLKLINPSSITIGVFGFVTYSQYANPPA